MGVIDRHIDCKSAFSFVVAIFEGRRDYWRWNLLDLWGVRGKKGFCGVIELLFEIVLELYS